MSRATLKAIQAAAGNAGGAVYVDDVFSTYLYEGNGTSDASTNQIQNGLDLSGEGGFVWIKKRSGGTTGKSHSLFDTERGAAYRLKSDTSDAETVATDPFPFQFNSDGFTVKKDSELLNFSGRPYVSWSFRKQRGFFDVVTYTGDGVAGRTVSHNLGSVPGMIIVKRRDANSSAWQVYHRANTANPETDYLALNGTGATTDSIDRWNDTAPTSTEFTLGNNSNVNASGGTYIAYLFAHDDQRFGENEDESIIKCGSYTGNGTSLEINVGFEPQWLLIRNTGGANWNIFDSMRGIVTGGDDWYLEANSNSAESNQDRVNLTATGFNVTSSTQVNQSGENHIYVAIRRPHKPAEEFAATDLFAVDQGGTESDPHWESGFPVDMAWHRHVSTTMSSELGSRLTGTKYLKTDSTAAELNDGDILWDYMDGWYESARGSTWYSWMFRRAPGFFDVVTYTGDNVNGRDISHNLGVIPEMIWVKKRTASTSYGHWFVFSKDILNTQALLLNLNIGVDTSTQYWDSTDPTASVFTVGSRINETSNSGTYVAYLFATVPGISKVGSYSGTGSDLTIDCGFTNGARFVLVKSTSGRDWHLWDSARGITTNNDPYLSFNTSNGQASSSLRDIEPHSSGFIANGGSAHLNSSGNDYIFLAIA